MSILIAISGIIGGIIFRTQHVFLRNTVYKKDVKELSLNYQGVDVDELNKCSELESLKIWGVNDDFLTEIKLFSTSKVSILLTVIYLTREYQKSICFQI